MQRKASALFAVSKVEWHKNENKNNFCYARKPTPNQHFAVSKLEWHT